MNTIKNVLICGIGAVGSIYANRVNEYKSAVLKVLVDKNRLENYRKNPKIFNGKELKLDYVLPDCNDFKADLIIIATKYDGLNQAVDNIKNFVKENTIILSLLNGVDSEEIIARKYGSRHTLLSFFIGHSAMREGSVITHDGTGYIVFGRRDENTCLDDIAVLKDFFDRAQIDYKTPDDMYRALWLKFILNVSSNQPSAIFGMTFGQMRANPYYMSFMKNIMEEAAQIARACGVKNTDSLVNDALIEFNKMIPEGKTSMLQDVEAKRKTEVDMFAGTIIKLGKKYAIPTPYNKILKEMINVIERNYLSS